MTLYSIRLKAKMSWVHHCRILEKAEVIGCEVEVDGGGAAA